MSNNYKLIEFPKISLDSGDLSFLQSFDHIPFDIKRIFYMYNLKHGKDRGKHAHKNLHQLIIPVYGSLDVRITNGFNNFKNIHLDKSNIGLHIPPMTWVELVNIVDDSVVLVVSSDYYDEEDYIRDYDEFLNLAKKS